MKDDADKWAEDLIPGELFVGSDGVTYRVPSQRLLDDLKNLEYEAPVNACEYLEELMRPPEDGDDEEDDDEPFEPELFTGCETVDECLERLRGLPTIDWDYVLLVFSPVYRKCGPRENGYWAEIEEFPGCVADGDTIGEARANIREAAKAWVLHHLESDGSDPFYSEENQARLRQSIADVEAGRVAEHELIRV